MSRNRNRSKRKKIDFPPIQQGQHLGVPTSTGKPLNQSPPVFSLEYMDGGDYSLDRCEVREKADFADALYKRSCLTWNQIQCAPRHGLGPENIPRHIIRTSIPQHVTPDVTLNAFRFSGKKPMVGYRQGRIFYVLWLDRQFTLYPHGS